MTVSLFSIEFPDSPTDEELAKLHADNPQLDPYYITTSVTAERRALFEECYKLYEPYEDSNFLKEITTSFHQRTWEMYLGAVLITNGKTLNSDRNDNHADIQVVTKKGFVHVECTAITPGEYSRPDSVPPMRMSTLDNIVLFDVPEEKILLRIAQALRDKCSQYKARLADGRVSEKEPYVIAINTAGAGHSEHLPRILMAVFGIGHQALRMRENGQRVASPTAFWTRRASIKKENGEEVDMTFFEKDENIGISAIIYTRSDVLNCLLNPDPEDVIVVHNPLAVNPISFDEFDFLPQYHFDKSAESVMKIEAKASR
ncbi:MAG: hypothetical protein RL641_29 [Candidatus Parcubacteria bacterium]|jgi:hypothetical protein